MENATEKKDNQSEFDAPENGIIKEEISTMSNYMPKRRQDLLHWNKWGFKDSGFILFNKGSEENSAYELRFTGTRYYKLGNGFKMPYFYDWITTNLGLQINNRKLSNSEPLNFPSPIVNKNFLLDLQSEAITSSFEGMDRLFRSHGHTLKDMARLRIGFTSRIPDIVVWPECHDHVKHIITTASKHDVAVIPVGGGTNVTGALACSFKEKRMIVSLDTSQMNKILWIDEENLIVRAESGIVGKDLENRLKEKGFTTGHEPDSYELSSLGGWVATRASGMKKNSYGNIEDLVVSLRVVTPNGEWSRGAPYPRVSNGPDMKHIMLGSEGTLGVITEVSLKIRPLPIVQKYVSFLFPDLDRGVKFMREVARQRCQPASLRLVDNDQFKAGYALRTAKGPLGLLIDGLKMLYITRFKGIDMDKICFATIIMEGNLKEVAMQEENLNTIGFTFEGVQAGETYSRLGYQLTFTIAYIRDFALDYGIVSESFETSVSWDRVLNVINNTKKCLKRECKNRKIAHYMVSSRVSQVYDAGAVVYFYFSFNYGSMDIMEAVNIFEEIETIARNEIISSGGSLSHHHGIGKVRQKWLTKILTSNEIDVLHSIKREIDPKNVMAAGNLVFKTE